MRIGFISDVHLEFYRGYLHEAPEGRTVFHNNFTLPAEVDADVLVVAGDIHPIGEDRHRFLYNLEKHYKLPVLHTTGNHDYYHGEWPGAKTPTINVIGGKKFVSTTLWTNLSDYSRAAMFCKGMNDYHLIEGISVPGWHEAHEFQRDFIFEQDPDVVITHHLPSFRSIPEEYKTGPYSVLNQFYASDLDKELGSMVNCKLWIHGHTHTRQDYTIGNVRVVCNPAGYPNEKPWQPEWKVVEV